ncbi:MAG: NADH-quinone oxidoreductase subunit F, partial [Ilumatobacteraceae bacterium]
LDLLLEVGQSICPGDMPHASSEALGLDATPFPYKMTTICFVGPSAYVPVHSALTLFRSEFESRVAPARSRTRIPVVAAGGGQ